MFFWSWKCSLRTLLKHKRKLEAEDGHRLSHQTLLGVEFHTLICENFVKRPAARITNKLLANGFGRFRGCISRIARLDLEAGLAGLAGWLDLEAGLPGQAGFGGFRDWISRISRLDLEAGLAGLAGPGGAW